MHRTLGVEHGFYWFLWAGPPNVKITINLSQTASSKWQGSIIFGFERNNFCEIMSASASIYRICATFKIRANKATNYDPPWAESAK